MNNRLKHIQATFFLAMAMLALGLQLHAQDTGRRKTIDITSSFKPSLKPQEKIRFSASPAPGDSNRPLLRYDIPAQNLAMKFYPATLRPLAFEPDSALLKENAAYLKLGYGNFKTPFAKALATFGDGVKSNGSVEGDYISSKGNLPWQQFSQYGAKANAWLNVSENNTFRIHGGFNGFNSYKYGYAPDDKEAAGDSLKVGFTHIQAGLGLANKQAGDAGIYYDAKVAAHFFMDNNEGRETAFMFSLPVEKSISDNAVLQIGVKGMLASFNGENKKVTNNIFMIPVGARVKLSEQLSLKAGAIPSWNNKLFKLLPDVEADYRMNENNLVLQAGWKGNYRENTYRTLAEFNPWIIQPDTLTNTRHSEVYAGVKSMVNEHISYRIKLGVGKMYDVPLFVNSGEDGRHFSMLWEPSLSVLSIGGEFVYQQGEKFYWSNALTANSYGQLKQNDKAFGLLPFEFRSSARYMIMKDLRLKADLYNFSAPYYREKTGGSKKGSSALDLNAGLEFDLNQTFSFWLQFNNIINMDYQRWNQYHVLGFQALGGVIVKL